MQTLLVRYTRRMLVVMAVFFFALFLGGVSQASADDRDHDRGRDGYRGQNGYYRQNNYHGRYGNSYHNHYRAQNYHHGYWSRRNGVNFWIVID